MIVIDVLLTFACFTNPSVHPGKKGFLNIKNALLSVYYL